MYIEYEGRRKPELYDMQNDPLQEENLMNTEEGRANAAKLKEMIEPLKSGGHIHAES